MKMGHRSALAVKIDLKWRILAINPLKLAFLKSNWPMRPLKSYFVNTKILGFTLGHNSHGITHENGLWGSRSQNRTITADFSYQSPKISFFDDELAFGTPLFF